MPDYSANELEDILSRIEQVQISIHRAYLLKLANNDVRLIRDALETATRMEQSTFAAHSNTVAMRRFSGR